MNMIPVLWMHCRLVWQKFADVSEEPVSASCGLPKDGNTFLLDIRLDNDCDLIGHDNMARY
jgi:hypothetical protein